MSSTLKKRVRVVLVDDSEVVRTGLKALLSVEPAIEIIGEATNVSTAVETTIRLKPEVLLLDVRLPDGTGFDACRQILQRLPETRVLVLTSVADDALVDEAIRAGAHGYLLKEINTQGLVQAIADVAAGKSILDPAITARVIRLVKAGGSSERDALRALSPQETRVLALIAEGRTNKEVGGELGLSEKTVKNYLSNIFEKLHVSRRAQAAAIYVQKKV
jgi:two-component system, NarL family, response regulator DevR